MKFPLIKFILLFLFLSPIVLILIFMGYLFLSDFTASFPKPDKKYIQVYEDSSYFRYRNCVWLGDSKIKQSLFSCADPDTFIVLGDIFSKDKNNVYSFRNVVDGIEDVESFIVFNDYYRGDKNQMYDFYEGINYDGEFRSRDVLVKNTVIDRESFFLISGGFAGDKNNIYFDSKIIEGVDRESFEILDSNYFSKYYAKDKNFVYYKTRKIDEADVSSFELINDASARDKNNCYQYGKNIECNKIE